MPDKEKSELDLTAFQLGVAFNRWQHTCLQHFFVGVGENSSLVAASTALRVAVAEASSGVLPPELRDKIDQELDTVNRSWFFEPPEVNGKVQPPIVAANDWDFTVDGMTGGCGPSFAEYLERVLQETHKLICTRFVNPAESVLNEILGGAGSWGYRSASFEFGRTFDQLFRPTRGWQGLLNILKWSGDGFEKLTPDAPPVLKPMPIPACSNDNGTTDDSQCLTELLDRLTDGKTQVGGKQPFLQVSPWCRTSYEPMSLQFPDDVESAKFLRFVVQNGILARNPIGDVWIKGFEKPTETQRDPRANPNLDSQVADQTGVNDTPNKQFVCFEAKAPRWFGVLESEHHVAPSVIADVKAAFRRFLPAFSSDVLDSSELAELSKAGMDENSFLRFFDFWCSTNETTPFLFHATKGELHYGAQLLTTIRTEAYQQCAIAEALSEAVWEIKLGPLKPFEHQVNYTELY